MVSVRGIYAPPTPEMTIRNISIAFSISPFISCLEVALLIKTCNRSSKVSLKLRAYHLHGADPNPHREYGQISVAILIFPGQHH